MPVIELLYDPDCPNVEGAREQLRRALTEVGLPQQWQEWSRASSESPSHARDYGSPTVLVNDQDVADLSSSDGANSCRIYTDEDGHLSGIPSVEMITSKLSSAQVVAQPTDRVGTRGLLSMLPSIGTAILPNLTCPACWPAYAGFLSALGVGFIDYTPYLLPLMVVFLGVALVSFGHRARTRRGHGPLILGVAAAAVVPIGKFVLDSNLGVYGGLALLVTASIWNAWPKRSASRCSCPSC